jgi:hypothetical protein
VTSIEQDLSLFDTVLIALYVPKAKPTNNFGLAPVLALLSHLLHQKNVCSMFWKPIRITPPNLKLAAGIVQVYQDLNFKRMLRRNY